MMNSAMFSSDRKDWETPVAFFEALNKEFNFTLDVCATSSNCKVKQYYSPADNGLMQDWQGVCWMNPPYGREISKWMRKASEAKATVVCLVPSRTDTAWWHDYVIGKGAEVRFIRGRLRFQGAPSSAPFPSALVIYRGE